MHRHGISVECLILAPGCAATPLAVHDVIALAIAKDTLSPAVVYWCMRSLLVAVCALTLSLHWLAVAVVLGLLPDITIRFISTDLGWTDEYP